MSAIKKSFLPIVYIPIFFLASCSLGPTPEELNPVAEPFKYASTGNIPLNDPQLFTFAGLTSGLYPWGNSMISNQYKTDYINISAGIQGLNTAGAASKNGKIVILTIGASNPYIIFNGIKTAWINNPGFGKKMVMANAGVGGKDLPDILDPNAHYWNRVNKVLDSCAVTAAQVQIIFCIEDDLINRDTSIQRAYAIKDEYELLLNTLRIKYVNAKIILFGDKGFNGYCTLDKFSEPKGYLNGWAVKLLVQDYANGLLPKYPFVNWLDYYWANGAQPRWDGLTYVLSDFLPPDYVHYTTAKANALGVATHNKLKLQEGTKLWYK